MKVKSSPTSVAMNPGKNPLQNIPEPKFVNKIMIRISQLTGYFPFSVTRDKNSDNASLLLLQFHWCSIPTLLTIFSIGVSILWSCAMIPASERVGRWTKSNAEKFFYQLWSLVIPVSTSFLKCRTMWKRADICRQWEKISTFQYEIQNHMNIETKSQLLDGNRRTIKVSMLRIILFLVVFQTVSCLISLVYDRRPWNEVIFDILLLIFVNFHYLGNTIWIAYVINQYKFILKLVAERITALNSQHDFSLLVNPGTYEFKLTQIYNLVHDVGEEIQRFNQLYGLNIVTDIFISLCQILLMLFLTRSFWVQDACVAYILIMFVMIGSSALLLFYLCAQANSIEENSKTIANALGSRYTRLSLLTADFKQQVRLFKSTFSFNFECNIRYFVIFKFYCLNVDTIYVSEND